jgi:hypothetical protein
MTLLDVLRENGSLLEGEDAMLLAPDARELPAQAQLKYLADNRRVGRFVTGLAGGVRLLLLAGGAFALVATMLDGETPLTWWSVAIALVLFGAAAWFAPPFFRRMRELNRRLPEWSELETQLIARADER